MPKGEGVIYLFMLDPEGPMIQHISKVVGGWTV